MRTLLLSLVLLSIACSVFGQLANNNWEGTWSNGKRGSSSLYICADQETRTAHGTYGNAGLISGYLWGNTFTGYWYEAGYDRPFGPFQLTIDSTGSSFTGSWSYFLDDFTFNGTFSWSGTKSSSARPSTTLQCLIPADIGKSVAGVFGDSYICDHSNVNYLNTKQPFFAANFQGFGKVEGYSYDSGSSLLLSNFYYPDDDDTDLWRFKPENSKNKPFSAYVDMPNSYGADDDDSIFTTRVVVGRMVTQTQFCGWFWYGFYSVEISSTPICFERTIYENPDPQACAFAISDIREQDHIYDDGNTSQLIKNIQDAFNEIHLPRFQNPVIVKNGTHHNITYTGGSSSPSPSPSASNATAKLAHNIKEIDGIQYIQDNEYVIVCNSASSVIVSIAAILALVLAF